MDSLFAQLTQNNETMSRFNETMTRFNEMPDLVRNKIMVYYLGFGTPSAKILMTPLRTINEIKTFTTVCTDDFTFWRYKIAKTQNDIMNIQSRTFSGFIALCELSIAYNISELCNTREYIKNRRIYTCEMAIEDYGIIPMMI
jgi:hypothetical protein